MSFGARVANLARHANGTLRKQISKKNIQKNPIKKEIPGSLWDPAQTNIKKNQIEKKFLACVRDPAHVGLGWLV